ncbi:MAG TPA: FtsX-like permease family protein [Dehalococcoidia bacterium]|nr:FtsX-like permease family protein [Dehalococcoidia bacterium]
MSELFGLPMATLAVVLPIALGAVLAVVAGLALRQPVLLRLSSRYLARRKGRTALIVVGLMLGTTIIAAALSTGDTMTHTIRSAVLTALGNTDEVISSQEESDIEVTGEAAQLPYFDEASFPEVRDILLSSGLVDGVAPAIAEFVGVQDLTSRQTEPRVMVNASDPRYYSGFGQMRNVEGGTVELSELGREEVYLNADAARELAAKPGDQLAVFAGGAARQLSVRAIVRYDGAGTTESSMMMPLDSAQRLFDKEGLVRHIIVSNKGGAVSGAAHTDEVIAAVKPTLERSGLFIEPTKRDDLKEADDAGSAFTSFFMTFGTFSIIAGIMLIFLIFVMLAAERKSEMGIARAVGTERRHLVEMFLFEGIIYDVLAAAVGALLGIAVAYGMVFVMAQAVGVFGIEIRHDLRVRSIVVAYSLGVLLTFVVVTVSAWRVSVLNIVAAIRDLPEPVLGRRGRASLLAGLALMGGGVALAAAGLSWKSGTPFNLGVSLPIIGLVPLARWAGLPDRVSYTVPGVLLVAWWLLPADVLDPLLPPMSQDFSIWITSGVMVVAGATWVVMYNSDRALGALTAVFQRVVWLAPVLKTAVSYPLTNRFRTGMTLAMFTLVVFTLVVGATTTNAFTEAWNDVQVWGGGYDIRASTVRANPIPDMRAAIDGAQGLDPGAFEVIANRSLVNVEARQENTGRDFGGYALRGLDDAFLETNTYELGAIARGYTSAREVWRTLARDPSLAVVDALPAPRRADWGFSRGGLDFRLEGFYLDDGVFNPIPVEVRDPVTQTRARVTIIGVLKDAAPPFMIGISVSQRLVDEGFPEQAAPAAHFFQLRPGTDISGTAKALEATFLANGMEADVIKEEMEKAVGANRTFVYVIQGFLGLGLIVGVAALAVISARSVVERRHEIGVMRSIGFERSMVQLSFLLESSMVALVGILLGTGLGLMVAYNVISETADQPSWDNITFAVPWLNLLIVYAIVYSAALLAAFVPARHASQVYPAEALRYE